MSETMKAYYKAKSEKLQSQIDRIGHAYCNAETDEDFCEQVFWILQERACFDSEEDE